MVVPKISVQILGPVLVPVVAAAIGWYGIDQPQRARRLQTQTAYAEEQRKITLQRDIADREALLGAYRERLSTTADTDWLINQSALLAARAGIQFKTVKPDPPSAERGYTRLAVTVESLATYHELGRFVGHVESAQPFIRVERVKIGAASATDEAAADGRASAGRRKVLLTLSTIHLP